MPFTDWDDLLDRIHERKVIPIVGPELNQLSSNRTLHQALTLILYPTATSLDEALSQSKDSPEKLRKTIRKLVTEKPWPTPTSLSQLAAIRDFDVYISVNFDPLLEQAFTQPPLSFSYRKTQEPDLPSPYQPLYEDLTKCPATPAVYHLFGKADNTDKYALTEEDILEYCHILQNRDRQPENLFHLLRERDLLVLGCGFPGWFTRFFLAAAKRDDLFLKGAPGVLADQESLHDRKLVLFLQRRQSIVFEEGTGADFVAELHRRWTARNNAHQPAPPAPLPTVRPGVIFISYASEDRVAASAIRDQLAAAGHEVWFDQRKLEPGDAFRPVILQAIEQCRLFVPVISRNSAVSDRRFYRLEWNKAVDDSDFRDKENSKFIRPVVIDDTPPDHPAIPKTFRDVHWARLVNGALPADFASIAAGAPA